MTSTQELRMRIRAIATVAFDAVSPVWPIGGFIATNPLAGLEDRPFDEAVRSMRRATGARGYLEDAYYRDRYARGLIAPAALEAALERAMADVPDRSRVLFGRTVTTRALLRASLTGEAAARTDRGTLEIAVAARLRAGNGIIRPERAADSPSDTVRTLGERLDARDGTDVVASIDDRTACWCAAFLDEGEAAWSMPDRDAGFYATWRRLARYDTSDVARGIPTYRRRIREALPVAEDAVAAALAVMDVPYAQWPNYLARHALQMPGWAGMVKWRTTASVPIASGARIDPIQYLAVRLWYEAALVDAHAARRAGEARPDLAGDGRTDDAGGADHPAGDPARTLASVATALALSETEVLALSDDDVRWLVAGAGMLDTDRRGSVWLEAHERTVRRRLLATIGAPSARSDATDASRGDVVFCIDVRSEGYRRHLEACGPYRTRGFAGFYGLPIALRSVDSDWPQQACPVLLRPKHAITERVIGSERIVRRHRAGRRFIAQCGELLDEIKGGVASPFVLFESLGLFFVLPLAGRTFVPRLFAGMRERVTRALVPPARTEFRSAKSADVPEDGFTLAERLYFAEAALSLMAMRRDFARLVLLVGHGSTTENNPLEASLDCGACAGYRGGPNARILAAMLNEPAVRAGLRERGIAIPDATVFIGGEHDTAVDRVTIADASLVPASHRDEFVRLQCDLDAAGVRLAEERMRRLDASSPRERASAQVQRRSNDWAQVRPEWGLAGNAAFIIAPRAFTRGVDLDARTFLHEYDIDGDRDGALLEIIMTAPLVVAQWINTHYYFATVDNERYGSGTKVLHNVVGRIGVISGNRGDLRAGLPLQSLADRNGWYHEPLRLLAVVTAPRARIAKVIDRNAVLQRLLHHAWMALIAWDPESRSYWTYETNGTWEPCDTDGADGANADADADDEESIYAR